KPCPAVPCALLRSRSSADTPPARPVVRHRAGAKSWGGFLRTGRCGWPGRKRKGFSWVVLQQRSHAVCSHVTEGVVINHQCRRLVAVAQAAHRQQGEAVVGGGLPRFDAEGSADTVQNRLVTADEAGHAVADADDVPANRLAEDLAVEGGDTLHIAGRDTENLADGIGGAVRHPAASLLNN